MFAVALLLSACGGGGSSGSEAPVIEAGDPTDMSRYATSLPLTDNSGSSTYSVLLIGNSHASALGPVLEQLLMLGQPGKRVDVQIAPRSGFLAERVNDGVTAETLESQNWTHVILQAQKYSSSGAYTYPTTAAEYWIRGAKQQGATPIMFPEHPRRGNSWEGQTLWELHSDIATRENACVAPVGLVWDEVLFTDPSLLLHQPDGNHASAMGVLLTALVFYQIITGDSVESLPALSALNVEARVEVLMETAVSSQLFAYVSCVYEK